MDRAACVQIGHTVEITSYANIYICDERIIRSMQYAIILQNRQGCVDPRCRYNRSVINKDPQPSDRYVDMFHNILYSTVVLLVLYCNKNIERSP